MELGGGGVAVEMAKMAKRAISVFSVDSKRTHVGKEVEIW